MEESNHEQVSQDSTATIKETIVGIGGCLTYLIFAFGGLVLIIMAFKGTPWIAENIYPWVMWAAGISAFIVVPVSLLLAIFRRTRGIGGAGLFFSSYVIGLSTWVWSLIIAYSLAGVFWMIIGLVFGGVGIVPIAFIASLLKAEWAIALQILVVAVVVFVLRGFGLFLSEKSS